MSRWPFDTVLVANRGEIAVRILRSVHALGLRSVAVYSDADASAPHVALADRAVRIGPAPVGASYLEPGALIDAARRTGAGAIHPGYGFLSERDGFCRACIDAGLVFVGPGPEAIRVMGDKRLAKARMIEAGVPCIPGYLGDGQDAASFLDAAARVGYPVMVKAAAGGGGRGMRIAEDPAALRAALHSASSEARGAFGDGTLYLEKVVRGARHVEVQVLADRHGRVLHLGERDCSLQRRHQKVVEEAPSPAVDPVLRARMTADAVAAARAIGYENAGTVEFLLGADGAYWFLEMNTRLQVEHPVTELVTGLDLVELQLRVAAGEPLGVAQEDVRLDGHAIEARLYAEDPAQRFLPQTGRVAVWSPPSGEGIRVDAGIVEGQEVTPHYDPMLAKIVASGRDREEARRRLVGALQRTAVLGVVTNRDHLLHLLRHDAFVGARATTDFVDGLVHESRPVPLEHLVAAALLSCRPDGMSAPDWRRAGEGRWQAAFGGSAMTLHRRADGIAHVELDGASHEVEPVAFEVGRIVLVVDGIRHALHCHRQDPGWLIQGPDATSHLEPATPGRGHAARRPQDGSLLAPMSGRVVRIDARPGDRVEAGTCVLVVEAMKMEHPLLAPCAGTLVQVSVALGAQVRARQVLANVTPADVPDESAPVPAAAAAAPAAAAPASDASAR